MTNPTITEKKTLSSQSNLPITNPKHFQSKPSKQKSLLPTKPSHLELIIKQPSTDLKGSKSITTSILDLLRREILSVPLTQSHPHRLLHVNPHYFPHEPRQPRHPHLRPVHPLRRQSPQIHHIRHRHLIILNQFIHVFLNPYSDEGEPLVHEEIGELVRDEVGVEDLEDQAAPADADLDQRHHVDVPAAVRAPLEVHPDEQAVEAPPVDLQRVGNPVGGDCTGGGDGGPDVVGRESHGVSELVVVEVNSSRH
ncbi:hypothetical protein LUZ60_000565 [Juncus effusus]|nr:hypothetical protein LUZ60_000565 [Juncus effusus]